MRVSFPVCFSSLLAVGQRRHHLGFFLRRESKAETPYLLRVAERDHKLGRECTYMRSNPDGVEMDPDLDAYAGGYPVPRSFLVSIADRLAIVSVCVSL